MPTEAETSRIIELHESGKSQREIADEIGKSQPTINNWIKDLIKKGLIKTDQSRTKNANQARREYCAEKRLALIDAGMKKLEEMLPETFAEPARDRQCKYCGAAGLTAVEVARHGRARKRHGVCSTE